MTPRRRHIFAVLLLVAATALGVFTWGRAPKTDEERTLASLRRVDDFPFYVMRYYGDYGFHESLQTRAGLAPRADRGQRQLTAQWACTCFVGLSPDADIVFGRNFDWTTQAALLLFTDPPDGYASISMVDITYLGFARDAPGADQRRRLLHAPFMPFDGMNEKGLAVGMMAVDGQAPQDPNKVTIDSLEAIRLLLDYASDVEEAIALLKTYNISFEGEPPLHYLVADATGRAAVVEYVAGEMRTIHNAQPWQVATNFVLSEELPQGARSSCRRYNAAWEALQGDGGKIRPEEAMDLLQRVAQSGDTGTRWSVVYDLTSGDVRVAMGRQYQRMHEFELPLTR